MSARWPFACFAALGAFWGAWAALIPDIKSQVGATDGELGTALLFAGIGATPAMLIAGRLWRRLGWWLLPIGGLIFAVTMLPPIAATNAMSLALVAALFGAGSGFLDVSMNAAVSDVEASRGSRLMFGAHALFSLGVLLAALGTGLARQLGAPPSVIFGTVALVTAAIAIGTISTARAARGAHYEAPIADAPAPAVTAIAVLAALCAAAFLVEDAIQNWSALHVERGLGAGPAIGGAAPGVFAGAMFVGRALGQRLGSRFTERSLLSGGALMAALGAIVLAYAPDPVIALAALAFAGAGISTIAPALFARAGRLAGPKGRGAAIARVTSIGYTGFVIGPALVGLIAQATDLRTAIAALAVMALFVSVGGWLAMASDAKPRKGAFEQGEQQLKAGRA